MSLARLHVVTDDEVLRAASFGGTARALLDRFGDDIALHLRGHQLPGGALYRVVRDLAPAANRAGAALLVADRVDIALAVRGTGVRLGRHSLPIPAVQSILPDALLAWSAHGVPEAVQAARAGADFIVLGTIWATASHPGREPAGIRLVERAVRSVDAPVVAIGGVTPERAASAVRAGARGVAVLRGVWQAKDPVRAAGVYLDAMTDALRVSATPAGRKHD